MFHKKIYFPLIVFLSLFLSASFASANSNRAMIRKQKQAAAANLEKFYHKSAALVIGNGHYKNGWSNLPGALRDVDEVAAALRKHGFAVTLKKDLTKGEFDAELLRFIQKYGRDSNNRLLFYYSGHGHTEKLATGDQSGYLVMVDAGNPHKDMFGFEMGSIPMENLLVQAKRIYSKHVLFLFDSCFSGNILNARGEPAPDYVTDAVKRPVRQFITAGSAKEPVPDDSIFKTLFLDMINGDRKEPVPDGYLTGEELGLYLKQNLPGYNPGQHPQYGKINDPRLDKGDFVFFLEKKQPPRPARLTVQSEPQNATVKITNIKPQYRPGIPLSAGKYHLEVSAPDYETREIDIVLKEGEQRTVSVVLTPQMAPDTSYTDPTTGMEFVLVKGGCYQMGDTSGDGDDDEKPVHEVCVDDFYMGKYEVTNEQYRKYRSSHNSGDYKGVNLNSGSQPVVEVSWKDATAYARWLSQKSGKKYRLPSEAEWEYAARGGTTTARFWGDSPDDACRYANVHDSTSKKKFDWGWTAHNCTDGYAGTAPVGSFSANGYGLYDMLGNVWEWCSDWYGENYYKNSPGENPRGARTGSERVIRGGSCYNFPRNVRSANRLRNSPVGQYFNLGFRLVLSVY